MLYALFSFLFAWGCMLAFTVIIGDTVPIVIRALFGIAGDEPLSATAAILTDRRLVILVCCYIVIFPICCARDITSLAKFSGFALLAIIMIAVCVIAASFNLDPALQGDRSNLLSFFKFEGIHGAIGSLSFAYVCHHNVTLLLTQTFLIYRSLKAPSLANFNKINFNSIGYAVCMFLIIGTHITNHWRLRIHDIH
jgi:solute carrier family 38 (sodium-coupled neutral amino acid transporter), member 11